MSSPEISAATAPGQEVAATSSPLPQVFGEVVAGRLADILDHQNANGAIDYGGGVPAVYPQQAILPLAFCWAGLDPKAPRWRGHPRVATAITRLGDYLLSWYDDRGRVSYDSHGYQVCGVDQRLTYAWLEALRLLYPARASFALEAWSDKISRACQTLLEEKLLRLQGVRRFVARVTGTGTNHVMLYLSTVYRAGVVLERPDFCHLALPIARALARDMHPDGYWDEHSDLQRSGGPTPSYNYITLTGMGLMAAWTGETIFAEAVARAARFHADFCYPDGTFLDLIDERARYDPSPRPADAFYDCPRVWGLFAFSGTPEGRGLAALHMAGWLAKTPPDRPVNPETLARHVENFTYWKPGPFAAPPTDQRRHRASLTLPAGLFRAGPWCLGLSAIRAGNAEDPAYRHNPFALERQKLFSVWHEKTGLIIDGSHSKHQPENSTFAAAPDAAHDYFPCGGEVGQADGEFWVRAVYKTFVGTVRLRPLDHRTLWIQMSVDPAATRGPFSAAFTLRVLDRKIIGLAGPIYELGTQGFSISSHVLGGGFVLGPITVTGARGFQLNWPLAPFNSYTSDHKSRFEMWVPRVSVDFRGPLNVAEFTIRLGA